MIAVEFRLADLEKKLCIRFKAYWVTGFSVELQSEDTGRGVLLRARVVRLDHESHELVWLEK